MLKPVLTRCAVAASCLVAMASGVAQTAVPTNVSSLRLASPVVRDAPSNLRLLSGQVQVAVRLTDPPLALVVGANAKRAGSSMTLAQRQAYMAMLKSKQDTLMSQVGALGGTELARVGKAYNALIISADASKLAQIAQLPGVTALRPIVNHQVSLTTTVPYIGAKALQDLGLTGEGVKIAVLDSGIDYTHRNLGGPGTAAAFATAAAAAATTAPGSLYPSAKVIGGYDFVGESWPNGPLAPDTNPIDAGTGSGHGTHVADIAAGASLDGLHKGVAPGAKLYAVKVCSSVSTNCSGTAILQGLDWAMDPRGDLSFADAADVVNLSLGANYGQRENPSTEAVSNLVRFGTVVAVAAGNAGDKPFIVSSPSNAAEAISVAQTSMPTASALPLLVTAPASIAGTYTSTNTVSWAPITTGFSGIVRRGSTTATAEACTAADTIDFTGTVALITRGSCSVSIKVANAAAKGAVGVLIANNAPGDPPSFSFGGGDPLVQTLIISQAVGNKLKTVPSNTASVSVNLANAISLAGSMESTSARGPGYNFSTIKPEIGAPGASISAANGTATGEASFGGTSGATPMIAGSAALLLQKFPAATPPEIKSRLMNSANTTIYTNPLLAPGALAPISRIGAGEVRVAKAAAATTGLWDATNPYNVSLSFGSPRVTGPSTFSKKVAVRNYGPSPRTYTISTGFRYADDAASGAVTFNAPATISVPANGSAAFALTMTIDASKLPTWNLDLAANQGDGSLLQAVEFDGYVSVADGVDGATVPWHVLPRKSANVVASTAVSLGGASSGGVPISNLGGALGGLTEVFALTGTSPQSSTVMPAYGGGQALIDLKAVGVRSAVPDGSVIQFGIAAFGERAHSAYPAEFDVYIDADNDGVFDYVIYNAENGGFGATGQTLTYVANLNSGTATAYYYAGADLLSANMIHTVPASAIGIASPTQQFTFSVFAYDNYFTGSLTDAIGPMKHTLATPRFSSTLGNSLSIPVGFNGGLPVSANPAAATASPSQKGLLLLYASPKSGRDSDAVVITP
ncbi:MAG: peptidase S8 [Rubrivivax sp.]|nr:MAG: peptidase S8 [Rubrivivax sp.]